MVKVEDVLKTEGLPDGFMPRHVVVGAKNHKRLMSLKVAFKVRSVDAVISLLIDPFEKRKRTKGARHGREV